ncbi:MAG: kelch repeat-containing protein, partial [Myxococcota bacterium]
VAETASFTLSAPAGAWRNDPSAVAEGTSIEFAVSTEEPLADVESAAGTGTRPSVRLLPNDLTTFDETASVLSLTPRNFGIRAGFIFESGPAPNLPDGTYQFWLVAEDLAGNPASLATGLTVEVDATAPNVPDVMTAEATVYELAPWGRLGSTSPDFNVRLTTQAVESEARVLVFNGQSASPEFAIGTSEPNTGSELLIPLGLSELTDAWVVAVDRAGNPSDADPSTPGVQATRVLDKRWTATFGSKTRANTAVNPHAVFENRSLDPTLTGDDGSTEPTSEELAQLSTIDGLGPTVQTGRSWNAVRPSSFLLPSARCGARFAPSPLRDGVLLYGGNGLTEACSLNDGIVCEGLWRFDGQEWQPLIVDTVPPARTFHSMVFDSDARRVLIFGGGTEPSGCDPG